MVWTPTARTDGLLGAAVQRCPNQREAVRPGGAPEQRDVLFKNEWKRCTRYKPGLRLSEPSTSESATVATAESSECSSFDYISSESSSFESSSTESSTTESSTTESAQSTSS